MRGRWRIRAVIIAADALGSLQLLLRLHANEVKAKRNGEAKANDGAEVKVDMQPVKTPAKKRRYMVVSKQVTAERKRAAVIGE